MERMEYKDFQRRMEEVAKARKIFIPHVTKNISIAFELYQEVLAQEKMEVFISTKQGGNKPMTPFDDVVRPRCEDCDTELRLKTNIVDADGKKYPTSWVCTECGREEYSNKSTQEWLEELKIETGKQNDKTGE